MAAPLILSNQGSLSYLQGESFTFLPGASGSPTLWESSALPPGLALNSGTGALTGPITSPGVYNVTLRASNAEGASTATFYFAIEAASQSDSLDADVEFDVITRAVRLVTGQQLAPASSSVAMTGAAAGLDAVPAPILQARVGDAVVLRVRVMKNGATVTIDPEEITLRVFAVAEDGDLLASSIFLPIGSGSAKRFRVLAKLEGPRLEAAVAEEAGTRQTRARLFATLAITYNNPDAPGFGDALLNFTSDAFGLEVFDA